MNSSYPGDNCWDNQNEFDALHSSFFWLHIILFSNVHFLSNMIAQKRGKSHKKLINVCSLSYIHKNINLLYSFCQACMSCIYENAQGSSLTTSVFFPKKKLKTKIRKGGKELSISVGVCVWQWREYMHINNTYFH